MKTLYTFLIVTFSVCTLYAQNLTTTDKTIHIFSWDGKLGTGAFQTASVENLEANHFVPVWTGNGLDQMNINVVLATLDGVNLEPGDEIAVFDGTLCVGMSKLSAIIDNTHMLNIKASRNDGSGNGYTPGHPIIYKYWDQSAGKEIEIITPYYYTTNPAWSNSGNYEADGTAFVELTGKSYITQTIDLTAGWNIFSVYLTPENRDMKALFQSRITDGSLIKVQDEKGNSLEDYGMFGGWTNNIGNISLTEGYKAKVSKDCQLVLQGIPAMLPFDIPLTTGWNIMGYPRQYETNGMAIMQPLINRNTLVKVQDEKGNSIEDYGMFGGWTNNIGNFKPGKGYKVKVTANETLTISESGQVQIPSVTTAIPDSITICTVILGGEVTNDGGTTVTERGICYGTTQTPTTESTKVAMGSGTGAFKSKVTGLAANTTYYVRAYAINSQGTAYGEQVTFTTTSSVNPTGTFTDTRDNKIYKWVQIGSQTWMAENLAYLPSVNPPTAESYTAPYYYVYGYSGMDVSTAKATANYTTYGVLYNWPAALTACPAGWHLPGDAEWTVLENYLIANGYNYDGTTSGNKIAKSMATATGWNSHSGTGTVGNTDYPAYRNKSGFSGLPGGARYGNGGFYNVGDNGDWWSSTEYSTALAWGRYLYYCYTYVNRDDYYKDCGFSVRCLRDF